MIIPFQVFVRALYHMPQGNLHNLESNLNTAGLFSEIDIHFARFIERFSENEEPDIFLAAALASRATGGGDICLDLNTAAGTKLIEKQDGGVAVVCPPLGRWRKTLNASPAVGNPGDKCPLILDARNRLYLYRYWSYEYKLSESIRQRAKGELQDFNSRSLKNALNRLFPSDEANNVDWQQIASVIAVLKQFSVITGGPGSGKTFTIARILAILLECSLHGQARIYLAAPTGKAAARLGESIVEAKKMLDCSNGIKKAIPDEVYTIHRLLKPVSGTPYFYYNSENLLPADIVVIDEASMVDLALMSKLIQSLAPETRLLLIGDKDQLASVEAGSVLGDICDRQVIHGFTENFLKKIEQVTKINLNHSVSSTKTSTGLQDCITVLQRSYRFSRQSGIGGLSRSVNRGDGDAALALLKDPAEDAIDWREIHSSATLSDNLSRLIVEGYRKYLTITDPVLAMVEFNRFKVLCALKIGPFGVNTTNRLAEQVLSREGLLPPIQPGDSQWYRGRPVLITRNDYNLDLFNGDIGITMPDPDSTSTELYVYFSGLSGECKRFPTHRLGEHQTVYAMTVHKSQGSEFDQIVLLLPERDYPLLTRELIYTGLTRAKEKVSIWGSEPVIKAAIARKIGRTSGLREALWA